MRCKHCGMRPVVVDMTGTDGITITMASCCIPQWFRNGQPVPLAEATSLIPKRRPRANGKDRFRAELAAALRSNAA